jgi:hypothetical protein
VAVHPALLEDQNDEKKKKDPGGVCGGGREDSGVNIIINVAMVEEDWRRKGVDKTTFFLALPGNFCLARTLDFFRLFIMIQDR